MRHTDTITRLSQRPSRQPAPLRTSRPRYVRPLLTALLMFVAAPALVYFGSPIVRAYIVKNQGGTASHSGHPSRQIPPIYNGLADWLQLDGNAGDTGSFNATLVNFNANGADGYVVGKYGQALKFDGVDDFMKIANPPTISGDFSIFGWVYLTAYPSSNGIIYSQEDSSNSDNGGADLYVDSTGHLTNYLGSAHASSGTIALNQWVQVGVTYVSGTVTMYLNGSSSGTGTGSIPSHTIDHAVVGAHGGATNPLTGSVDDLRVYTRGLSGTEAGQLYSGTSVTGSLADLYQFDGNTSDAGTLGPSLLNFNFNSTDGYVPGKYGQGLKFDGVDDLIKIPRPASIGGDFSIFSWLNLTSYPSSNAMIFSLENSSNVDNGGANLYLDRNGYLHNYMSYDQANSVPLPLGQWVQVGVTYIGGTIKLYVNGVVAASGSGSIPSNTIDHASIGGHGGGTDMLAGTLDDLRLYSRGLSTGEAQSLFVGSQPANCDQTCVGWWKLDDGTGTSALDGTSNANTGTLTNFTFNHYSNDWVTGAFGGALLFNGSNTYVTVPSSTSLTSPTTAITVEAWVQASSTTQQTSADIVNKLYSSSAAPYVSYALNINNSSGNNNWNFAIGNGTTYYPLISQSAVTTNWTHLAGVYDGSTLKLYVNGKLDASSSLSGATIGYNSSALYIGYSANSQYFNGIIDDVRVYKRALTDYQIFDQYSAGR